MGAPTVGILDKPTVGAAQPGRALSGPGTAVHGVYRGIHGILRCYTGNTAVQRYTAIHGCTAVFLDKHYCGSYSSLAPTAVFLDPSTVGPDPSTVVIDDPRTALR